MVIYCYKEDLWDNYPPLPLYFFKGGTYMRYFIDDDEEETYRIVTTVRSNSQKNLVSNESPIGKALLGHKVGDKVEVRVNDNYSYELEIRKIEKTTDEGNDKIRSF